MRRNVWKPLVIVSVLIVGGIATGPTANAGWAELFFGETNHDFGAVPRGAKVRHSFVMVNRSSEPVTIMDVRASCGCTTGRAMSSQVPSGASTTIEAEMDTRNFAGRKATTLFVTLMSASGRQAEVRLGVSSTILSDIVLNPGTVDFGVVSRGQTPTLTLTIDRVGLPSWQVHRMISTCRAIDASLNETSRNGQSVSYVLKVSLRADASPGTFKDELQLLTNDRETPIVPIQVTASIRGELTATPSVLALGRVASAGVVQGRFLVRASNPFIVRTIEGEGDGFQARTDDDSAKPVHLVTVTYRPEDGKDEGDVKRVFRLHTDVVGEAPLELTATLHVVR